MKKYHVYGISGALVDMEFEVAPEFLKKYGIQKGVMTLVGEDRQHELIQAVHGLQHKRCCGGSGVNTVISVAQFGGSTFCSCRVSEDEFGDFYMKDLHDHGVKTNLNSHRPQGVTGKCLVFITPDADRTMNTFLGVTENLCPEDLNEDELKRSHYIYIEGYVLSSPTGRAAAMKAKALAQKHGVKVSLTFSDPAFLAIFRDARD